MRHVLLNGNLLPETEAFIPVDDRGFLFGDGLFTTMRLRDGILEAYAEHKARLHKQALEIGLSGVRLDLAEIAALAQLNGALQGTWRIKAIFTSAAGKALSSPERRLGTRLLSLAPISQVNTPLRVLPYPEPVCGPFGRIKSLAYQERLFMRAWAEKHGYDEVLTVGAQGEILELGTSNLCWLEAGTLYYPDPQLCLLDGVALKVLRDKFRVAQSCRAHLQEIPETAEIFACNAVQGLRAVEQVGLRHFPIRRWKDLGSLLDAALQQRGQSLHELL